MENWLLPDGELLELLGKDDRKKIKEAFFAFADFSKHHPEGRISYKELKLVLEDIGQSVTEEELHKMICENSMGAKDYMDQFDFLQMMGKSFLHPPVGGFCPIPATPSAI